MELRNGKDLLLSTGDASLPHTPPPSPNPSNSPSYHPHLTPSSQLPHAPALHSALLETLRDATTAPLNHTSALSSPTEQTDAGSEIHTTTQRPRTRSISSSTDTGHTDTATLNFASNWGSHWRDIDKPDNQSRRHIVMMYPIRQALTAVHENAHTNDDEQAMKRVLREFVQAVDGDPIESGTLTAHFNAAYSALYNLHMNIFIGDSDWNATIGSQAARLIATESGFMQRIQNTTTIEQVSLEFHNWYAKNLTTRSNDVELRSPAHQYLQNQFNEMKNSVKTALSETDSHTDAQKIVQSTMRATLDSMSFDLSEHPRPDIVKWHNANLTRIHILTNHLKHHPTVENLTQLLHTTVTLEQEFKSRFSTQ